MMAEVTIVLPSLLRAAASGATEFKVTAETLHGALQQAIHLHPSLKVHLFDESGDFRQHVLCFHNDINTRWTEQRDSAVQDGDVIRILQAVSGG